MKHRTLSVKDKTSVVAAWESDIVKRSGEMGAAAVETMTTHARPTMRLGKDREEVEKDRGVGRVLRAFIFPSHMLRAGARVLIPFHSVRMVAT